MSYDIEKYNDTCIHEYKFIRIDEQILFGNKIDQILLGYDQQCSGRVLL